MIAIPGPLVVGDGSGSSNSAVLRLDADDNIANSSSLTINSDGLVQADTFKDSIGPLSGSGRITTTGNGALRVNTDGQSSTFSGIFTSAPTFGGLIKQGTGTLILTGNSPSGHLDVLAGTVLINGTAGKVDQLGGRLGGIGTVGNLALDGGSLAPGNSTGTLKTGNLELTRNGTLEVEITSATFGQFDQLNVDGTVNFEDIDIPVGLSVSRIGTISLADGDEIIIINNDLADAVTGTFRDLPEGANLGSNFLGSGLTAKITYDGRHRQRCIHHALPRQPLPLAQLGSSD